jgi:hypothetical protein
VTRLTGSGNGAAVEPPGTDEPSTERTSTPGELSVLLLPPCHYGFPQRYERCVVRCSGTRSGSWALTELLLVVEPGVLWCSVWQLLSTLRCLSVCLSVCLCVCVCVLDAVSLGVYEPFFEFLVTRRVYFQLYALRVHDLVQRAKREWQSWAGGAPPCEKRRARTLLASRW